MVRFSWPTCSAFRIYETSRALFLHLRFWQENLRKPTGTMKALILPVAIAQLGVGLVVIEDLGSAVVMGTCFGVLILAVGLPLKWFGLMLLGIFPIFYHFVASTPFRIRRIMGFIDPWAHRETSGYQITEALISIGSGGISGVGLGSGKESSFIFYLSPTLISSSQFGPKRLVSSARLFLSHSSPVLL